MVVFGARTLKMSKTVLIRTRLLMTMTNITTMMIHLMNDSRIMTNHNDS